jgi:50S ribosome-binding GTPase
MNADTEPGATLVRAGRWTNTLHECGFASETVYGDLHQILDESWHERLDTAGDAFLVLMLCGPTAVGKSSLINVLARAEISREGIGATTSVAVLYVHEKDDPARLFEYSEAFGQLGRDRASIVRHNRDELLHKVLVDTPDIDSVVQVHGEITESLVHHSDLVLFVTSPERYKIMKSARWIARQREQRAIGFVLNKWDRETFGLDYEHRKRVEDDFRAVLAGVGFSNPKIFTVSARDADTAEPLANTDNQIPALRTWIEQGLTRSAAVAIQDRRRRAAWGRLGAAIAPLIPAPLTGHSIAGEARARLAADCTRAKGIIEAEAAAVRVEGLDRSVRPETPGLLGSWIGFWSRIGGAIESLRSMFAIHKIGDFVRSTIEDLKSSGPAYSFGESAAALLTQATTRIASDAEFARVPLGPVPAAWGQAAERLRQRLSSIVAESEAQIIDESSRMSPRRALGLAALYAVEAALVAILLMTLWRVGTGFYGEKYVAGALLANSIALLMGLLLTGQILANLFFPPLQSRLRRVVLQRASTLIDDAWRSAQTAFTAQLQAADKLAEEGRLLMAAIDATVQKLAPPHADSNVAGLFGDSSQRPSGPSSQVPSNEPPAPAEPPPQSPARPRRVVLE